jgi:hypothetical protein
MIVALMGQAVGTKTTNKALSNEDIHIRNVDAIVCMRPNCREVFDNFSQAERHIEQHNVEERAHTIRKGNLRSIPEELCDSREMKK